MSKVVSIDLKPAAIRALGMKELNSLIQELGGPKAKTKEAAVETVLRLRRRRARAEEPGKETLRAFAEQLLRKPRTYSQCLAEVKKRFPDARTSRSSLRWYAAQMRARGESLPERPVDND